jgi:TolA-binding protein
MIIKSIFFLSVGIILSSCTLEKLHDKLTFQWKKDASHPQTILNSGKKHLQSRNYMEAKKCFDQIINTSPSSPEAKEAKFYSLLIDFLNWKESSFDEKKFFSEKDMKYLPDGFCSDAKGILPDLVKQFKNLHKTFSKLKKEDSKNKEELGKIKIDYQKVKTELEQLRENYRKMQEIEMRKEKMEKELRELSH